MIMHPYSIRSYVVNVKKAVKQNKAKMKVRQIHNKVSGSNALAATENVHTIKNGKTLVDVVYVAARHAKEVKNELELLSYLDKRYKMVKVERRPHCIDNGGEGQMEHLVAIPITKEAVVTGPDNLTTSSLRPENKSFQNLLVGRGKEMVPFSSASTGRMKQRK